MLGAITSTRLGKALVFVASYCAIRKAIGRSEPLKAATGGLGEDADFGDTIPATHALGLDDWDLVVGGLEGGETTRR